MSSESPRDESDEFVSGDALSFDSAPICAVDPRTREAIEALLPRVYDELRRIARGQLRRERRPRSLAPTALVHEAYLRLKKDDASQTLDRASFLVAAGVAMRRILIDRARRRGTLKRGRHHARVPLSEVLVTVGEPEGPEVDVQILDLDDALEELTAIDPVKGAIVTLRYLIGCSVEETAEALAISPTKVKQDWTFAKAWLRVRFPKSDA